MKNQKSFLAPIRANNTTNSNSIDSTNSNTILTNRVTRLSNIEYSKLETKVRQDITTRYRDTDSGSLGVVVGVEAVLRILREGWLVNE